MISDRIATPGKRWRIVVLNLASPIQLLRPPNVEFGVGTTEKLAPWIESRGYQRPFVIADTVNAARLEVLGLGGVKCSPSIAHEPTIDDLTTTVREAEGADVIIGFGGGSAMDLAKLVAVMLGNEVTISDISGPNRAPARKVGLVQVSTTAGTGSEVGTRALLTNSETMAKVAAESIHLLADLTIIDPSLTVSVPPHVTAATGVDALAHCVEAFTSKRAHPVIDDYALRGIGLIGTYLQQAVEDGSNLEARTGLALAAYYGGICLGPVNTTAGHAVAYPLGTRYKIPHGLANALIFPHTLAVNAVVMAEKTNLVLTALGSSNAASQDALHHARDFCESLGLEMRLSAHDVREEDLPSMAQEAHAIRRLLDWNPVDLAVTDIEAIYRVAY